MILRNGMFLTLALGAFAIGWVADGRVLDAIAECQGGQCFAWAFYEPAKDAEVYGCDCEDFEASLVYTNPEDWETPGSGDACHPIGAFTIATRTLLSTSSEIDAVGACLDGGSGSPCPDASGVVSDDGSARMWVFGIWESS